MFLPVIFPSNVELELLYLISPSVTNVLLVLLPIGSWSAFVLRTATLFPLTGLKMIDLSASVPEITLFEIVDPYICNTLSNTTFPVPFARSSKLLLDKVVVK